MTRPARPDRHRTAAGVSRRRSSPAPDAEEHVDDRRPAPRRTTASSCPQSWPTTPASVPAARSPCTASGAPVDLQVSGVYTDPTAPLDPYWEGSGFLFLPILEPAGELVYPPPACSRRRTSPSSTRTPSARTCSSSGSIPSSDGIDVAEARTAAGGRSSGCRPSWPDPESPVTELVSGRGLPAARSRIGPARRRSSRSTARSTCSPRRSARSASAAARPPWCSSAPGPASASAAGTTSCARSSPAGSRRPAGPGRPSARRCCPSLIGLAVGGLAGWLLVRELGPSPTSARDVLAAVPARAGRRGASRRSPSSPRSPPPCWPGWTSSAAARPPSCSAGCPWLAGHRRRHRRHRRPRW